MRSSAAASARQPSPAVLFLEDLLAVPLATVWMQQISAKPARRRPALWKLPPQGKVWLGTTQTRTIVVR